MRDSIIHSRDCSVQEVYGTIQVSQVRSLPRPPTVTTPNAVKASGRSCTRQHQIEASARILQTRLCDGLLYPVYAC